MLYKHILFISLIFIMISCSTNGYSSSTNGYIFNTYYTPSYTYVMRMQNETKTEVDFLENDELIKDLKSKGIVLPMQGDVVQDFISITETGSQYADGSFPAIIHYKKFKMTTKLNGQEVNNSENPNLEGLKIDATVYDNKKIKVNKIEGDKIDENLKKLIAQMVENSNKNIRYPDKQIKIGDQFTRETLMQMPVADLPPINFKIISTYSLKKVENNLAFFDIVQVYEYVQENKDVELEMSGNGEGSLIHDLSKNFVVEHTSKSKMIAYAKTASFTMKNAAFSESKFTVEINASN